MAILRLQHIGMAVHDLQQACDWFESTFGLKARDFRNDQGHGMQLDARILLGNACWLHLVQNWNPESRVYQFLHTRGPGLEHIALQTDSIEADVQHLRDLGVPIFSDKIFNANDGFEAFVYPDQTLCMTVELIQPHATSWGYPSLQDRPVSNRLGIHKLDHLGLAVTDLTAGCERLETFFGLKSSPRGSLACIQLPNDCWLSLQDASMAPIDAYLAKYGPGLDHIAFETSNLQSDCDQLESMTQASGTAAQHLGTRSGASIPPDNSIDTRVELVQQS
jgi:catechol 2,3-dioxygenase-like lactoylglutathione lyase family enzyme